MKSLERKFPNSISIDTHEWRSLKPDEPWRSAISIVQLFGQNEFAKQKKLSLEVACAKMVNMLNKLIALEKGKNLSELLEEIIEQNSPNSSEIQNSEQQKIEYLIEQFIEGLF